MWRRIKYHPFVIKLSSWEYWPVYISNIPVFFFWMIQAIRARDPLFFSAINPAIPTGGFFGEQKHKIYELIPENYLPKTFYCPESEYLQLPGLAENAEIPYPLICKPDVGERGMHVKVIESPESLISHAKCIPGGVIIQEYVEYPLELSVMVHRLPQSGTGSVTSICKKSFLSVTGDGRQTISALIDLKPRAILQKEVLRKRMDLERIPEKGEDVLLEAIGNHCRGTKFLNANHWINPALEQQMTEILAQMPGVWYGRFDLRTESIDQLSLGRNFLIMEFNGASSEPAHIYDPEYGALRAYRDLWKHWQIMYRIYREQKVNGVDSMPWREGWRSLRSYFSYKRKAHLNLSS